MNEFRVKKEPDNWKGVIRVHNELSIFVWSFVN